MSSVDTASIQKNASEPTDMYQYITVNILKWQPYRTESQWRDLTVGVIWSYLSLDVITCAWISLDKSGKISCRDTSKKWITIVKPTANQLLMQNWAKQENFIWTHRRYDL
jgi:hypothetical protein